ncbi:S66 peptidase family protein [Exiguobacterium sp. s193]|uniref:S66 family peptidase n=1 Tax=Exiguobacterium sp. s193 TaxID=2751207 RepID=UPI001BEC17C5|nr:S66 peptidase family protein [Exiguobacterium sp. s193]
MRYPFFGWTGQTIGITAVSSGLPDALHPLLEEAKSRLEDRQMQTVVGETVWTQTKAESAPGAVRAAELMQMMQHPDINAIIPPFGGERALDLLPHLAFSELPVKWLLGYSDTSTVLFAITVKTGIATAHGPNLLECRSEEWDETTAAWRRVLATPNDGSVTQWMSSKYQTNWDHDVRPERYMFHFDQTTEWKTLDPSTKQVTGRLLGGCLETIRHLIGTPYGDVRTFQTQHLAGEPILWYFEACQASATDLHRTLMQMYLAGWFNHASGILFGRTGAGKTVEDYTLLDVYTTIMKETGLPIFYDLDIGHQPPQMTLVNGATATVTLQGKDSRLDMTFN